MPIMLNQSPPWLLPPNGPTTKNLFSTLSKAKTFPPLRHFKSCNIRLIVSRLAQNPTCSGGPHCPRYGPLTGNRNQRTIKASLGCFLPKAILCGPNHQHFPLFKALIRPHLKYAIKLSHPFSFGIPNCLISNRNVRRSS